MNSLLTEAHFRSMLGDLPEAALDIISDCDWRFKVLEGQADEDVKLGLLQRLRDGQFSRVSRDKARWEKGWSENLEAYEHSRSTDALIPKYLLRHEPMRLFGRFVMPHDPRFELNWVRVYQEWLFMVMGNADAVYEFGCGSAWNLARMKERYPEKRYVGLDWTQASQDICSAVGIEGAHFDFYEPGGVNLAPNSAVFTFGALEQVGETGKLTLFIEWLIRQKPSIVIFSEPIVEWYDPRTVQDMLAVLISKERGYMEGLPAVFDALGDRVKILRRKRTGIGSVVLEGYSHYLWRPA